MKFWSLALLIFAFACHQAPKDPRNSNYPPNTTLYEAGQVIATIKDRRLVEASGIEYSTKNPGHLWVHNDSDGQPSLYLIDTLGQIKLTAYLQGATNYDWEDITSDGEHLYIAEIGDNRAERDEVKILMLEEPSLENSDSITINAWLQMSLQYANGPRDAETLMYDFSSDELVIISKRDESCFLYSFAFEAGSTKSIQPKGQLGLRLFTAGDINEAGEMILKNYDAIFFWESSNLPLATRFTAGPDFSIPYIIEPQGEAITFAPDNSFFTLSEYNEHSKQQLYFYQRNN